MAKDAESAGVIIQLVDGFRSYPEQKYLRDNMNKPGFNPAAKPGRSQHQNGIALDINNKSDSKVNTWLMKNSYKYGFVRNLKMGYKEGHHWEYRPGETRNPETKKVGKKKVTKYFFASWSPDKKWSNSDAKKWYANYYQE